MNKHLSMKDYSLMNKSELIKELAQVIEKYIKSKKKALILAKVIYEIYSSKKENKGKK